MKKNIIEQIKSIKKTNDNITVKIYYKDLTSISSITIKQILVEKYNISYDDINLFSFSMFDDSIYLNYEVKQNENNRN